MEELVRKIKNGDNKAFEEIVHELKPHLYIIAKSRISDEYIISEALQETFIALYLNIKKLKNEESFRFWITKVLINNCNRLAKKNKNSNISYEEANIENNYIIDNEYEDIIDKLDFFKLIEALELEERTLLTMFYLEKYTTLEMSKILKINESTIRSKIKRARDKIKLERGYENNEK